MRPFSIILILLLATAFAADPAPNDCASSTDVQQMRGVVDINARYLQQLVDKDYLTTSALTNETQKMENLINLRLANSTNTFTFEQEKTREKLQSIKYELYSLAIVVFLFGILVNQMLVAGAYRKAAKVEQDRIKAMKEGR